MDIYAKSAPVTENINNKVLIGCDGIEIQLLPNYSGSDYVREDFININNSNGIPRIVHTPINDIAIGLENLNNMELYEVIENAFALAQLLGKHYKRVIGVVIHNKYSLNQYIGMGILNVITEKLDYLLNKYDKTYLLIENDMLIYPTRKDGMTTSNGFLMESVSVVKYLRKTLNTLKAYTVLDMCHVTSTIRILNRIFEEHQEVCSNETRYSIEDYFYENKDVIGLIHLCSSNGIGTEYDTHGVKYCENNIDELKEVISCYRKYNYDCPITLEVRELDYTNAINYKESLETLRRVITDESR